MRRRSSAPKEVEPPVPFRMPDPAAEQRLAKRIGATFADPLILRLALTHRSVIQDWLTIPDIEARLQSNERLEFLGDAVLGAVVAEHLYDRDPSADEGTLTRQRVAIVRAETLVRWARELSLHHCLYLGTGERVSEGIRDRMLAGAFEALVGAIHIDRGRDAATAFVMQFLRRDITSLLANDQELNPKGRLQEVMQERSGIAPDYVTIAEEGPDHARYFTVAVVHDGQHIGVGSGASKRAAQQGAARQALISLGDEETLRAEADLAAAVPAAARGQTRGTRLDSGTEPLSREG